MTKKHPLGLHPSSEGRKKHPKVKYFSMEDVKMGMAIEKREKAIEEKARHPFYKQRKKSFWF